MQNNVKKLVDDFIESEHFSFCWEIIKVLGIYLFILLLFSVLLDLLTGNSSVKIPLAGLSCRPLLFMLKIKKNEEGVCTFRTHKYTIHCYVPKLHFKCINPFSFNNNFDKFKIVSLESVIDTEWYDASLALSLWFTFKY